MRQTKMQKNKKQKDNQLSVPQRSGDISKILKLKPGHKKLYGFWEPMASSWIIVR